MSGETGAKKHGYCSILIITLCGAAAAAAAIAAAEHFNFYQVAGLILQPPLRVRISRIDRNGPFQWDGMC